MKVGGAPFWPMLRSSLSPALRDADSASPSSSSKEDCRAGLVTQGAAQPPPILNRHPHLCLFLKLMDLRAPAAPSPAGSPWPHACSSGTKPISSLPVACWACRVGLCQQAALRTAEPELPPAFHLLWESAGTTLCAGISSETEPAPEWLVCRLQSRGTRLFSGGNSSCAPLPSALQGARQG